VFVVDTNILVYAADEDSLFHAACRRSLEEWRRQPSPWFSTWGILYEFLRVITHPRVFRHPWTIGRAWNFVEAFLASPSFGLLVPGERHAVVAASVINESAFLQGNLVLDAQTAILMREHGIRKIYTRDTDFHRFPFLEPVDPTNEF
jgi:toxin-antitoxin system PIN domain toxin